MIIRTMGKLGDIVYAMAAMRGHHLLTGDKCLVRVRQYHDPNDAQNHFYEEHQKLIARLLDSQQDYVSDVVMFPFGNYAASHVNLGTWLDCRRLHLDNLARSLCHYMKVDDRFAAEKWLKIDAPENGLTIINVTDRWKSMDREGFWRVISNKIPDDAIFIGMPMEHHEFQRLLNRSFRRQEVPDLFEAAKLIAGCREFFGNQSCLLAIAHALGKPVTVEVFDERPDCIFLRTNAQYPGTPDYIQERWGASLLLLDWP